MPEQDHVLSIIVENQPGVLARISGLFSGRGFNIESLCVALSAEEGLSCITLVTRAEDMVLEQIKKQLNKLIGVVKVMDYSSSPAVFRELALVKVRAKPDNRAEILRISDIFKCKVLDVGPEHYTLEVTGSREKIAALLELLKPMGIREVARTGITALSRETKKNGKGRKNGTD